MVARNIRERVAIALMACSLIVASVLGVMTVLAFQQGGLGGFSPSGQVSRQTASTGQNSGSTAATSGGTRIGRLHPVTSRSTASQRATRAFGLCAAIQVRAVT